MVELVDTVDLKFTEGNLHPGSSPGRPTIKISHYSSVGRATVLYSVGLKFES